MSYLETPVKVEVDGTMKHRLVGPSDIPPTPTIGYQIDPEPIEIATVEGKFWTEYKITTP